MLVIKEILTIQLIYKNAIKLQLNNCFYFWQTVITEVYY